MLTLRELKANIENKEIIRGFSATAQPGDYITIIGPNGAGKSTLFKALEGTLPIASGTFLLNDYDVTNLPAHRRAAYLSSMHQNPYVGTVASMTVEENIALALCKGKSIGFSPAMHAVKNNPVCDMIIRVIPHPSLLATQVKNLSGGQRQLLAFLLATIYSTPLLLLDEPTAALDATAADRMLNCIDEYVAQHPDTITLFVTHDPDIAREHGNRLWIIKEGLCAREMGVEKKNLSDAEFKQLIR